MKRIFLLGLLAFSQLAVFSQITLKGRVLEKETGTPLSSATIIVGKQTTLSDDNGWFELKLKSIEP